MNKENTQKIFNDFPELFKHRDNLQASLMAFGFGHGDGWFNLVYKLCEDIYEEYQKQDEEWKERFYVVQVKEKFAGLRFYTFRTNDEIQRLIGRAGYDSYHT